MPQRLAKTAAWNRRTFVLFACLVSVLVTGCSRRFWRRQADEDAYRAVSEKQTDYRWQLPRMDLTPDVRSRFFDPYDPDCAPLPPDDAAAHQFMHCSDGKEGYKHWHKFGDSLSVENPHWLEPYQVLMTSGSPVRDHAKVDIPKVTLRDAVDLTYIHSREYQTAIEDVFLSALNLTLQRYQLNSQFIVGGAGSGVGGAVVGADINRNAPDSTSIQNGLGVSRLLPVGTNLAVDVLNTITWNTSSGSGTATRLAWEITQPFLNGAGRKVIMEALTQAERSLLYEIRSLARFRQVLFTSVSTDYLGVLRQIQIIDNLENNIRQLQLQIEAARANDNRKPERVKASLLRKPDDLEIPADLRPFLAWDEQLQLLLWSGPMSDEQKDRLMQLSDDEDYQEAVRELIDWRELNVLTLPVAQLVTRRNRSENNVANARRQLADLLDSFKIRLGLPPNVQLTTDELLLKPFQLIDPRLISIEADLDELAETRGAQLIGGEDEDGSGSRMQIVREYVNTLSQLKERIATEAVTTVLQDFEPIESILGETGADGTSGSGRRITDPDERARVEVDFARDRRNFDINSREFRRAIEQLNLLTELLAFDSLETLREHLDADNNGGISADELPSGWEDLPRAQIPQPGTALSAGDVLGGIRDAAIVLREEFEKIVQGLQGVQVGLRVDAIALNDFTLPGRVDRPGIEEVVQIGLENRHDLMNARAQVMDRRRAVEIAANDLMSVMDLSASGTLNPDGGRNDGVDLSLNFKGPLNQVAERNVYRRALISYQRERRSYMALEDQVKQSIRESWRQLVVSRQRLEIDRQTVRNAALQYDSAALNATAAGQNNSLNLLNALDAVLNAQNSLVADWITYETNRLNIFRDMGIMELDSAGVWEDDFYQSGSYSPLPEDDFGLNPDGTFSDGLPSLPPPTTELTPQPAPVTPPVLENPNE